MDQPRQTLIRVKRKRADLPDDALGEKRLHLSDDSDSSVFRRVASLSEDQLYNSDVSSDLQERISEFRRGERSILPSSEDTQKVADLSSQNIVSSVLDRKDDIIRRKRNAVPPNSPQCSSPTSPHKYQVVVHDPILAQAQIARHFNLINMEKIALDTEPRDEKEVERIREAQRKILHAYYRPIIDEGSHAVKPNDFVYDVYARSNRARSLEGAYPVVYLQNDSLSEDDRNDSSAAVDECDIDSNDENNPAFSYGGLDEDDSDFMEDEHPWKDSDSDDLMGAYEDVYGMPVSGDE